MTNTTVDMILQARKRRDYINHLNESMAGLNQYGRMNNACVVGEMAAFIVRDYDNLLERIRDLELIINEALTYAERAAQEAQHMGILEPGVLSWLEACLHGIPHEPLKG